METISVIIPTYKRPNKLTRSVKSVLSQKGFFNIEVIVVDDNNENDEYRLETQKIMEEFIYDNRVIYLKHDTNRNGSAARNTGIKKSKGQYISFLDDDDFFLEGRLDKAINAIKSKNVFGVCCGYVKYNGSFFYKKENRNSYYNSSFDLLSLGYDFAAGSTMFLKREVFDVVGFFDENFFKHQDWEFLIRFFRNYALEVTSDISVVICTDGYRNITSTDKLINAKQMLFNKYSTDYFSFDKNKKALIKKAQYTEIVNSFLKERKYKDLLAYSKRNKTKLLYIESSLYYIFSFMQGLFPTIITFILFFIIDSKYRLKYKNIINSIKL